MLTEPTLDRLRALHLGAMADAYRAQLQDPAIGLLSFDERVGLLIEAEHLSRDNRKLTRRLKEAKLRIPNACLEDLDYAPRRELDRALIRLSRLMRDDDEYLERLTSQRWSRLVRQLGWLDPRHGDQYTVELAGWRRTSPAVQRRLVRVIAHALGHDEIGFEAVERALAVGAENGPRRAELGGGMTVERKRDTLFFGRAPRKTDE